METNKDFIILAIFADNLIHSYREVSIMTKLLIGKSDKWMQEWIKRAKENQWIKQAGRTKHIYDAWFQLSLKGDEKYREDAIRRGGDYSWFKYFDRTKESVEKFMPLKFRPVKSSRDVPVNFVSPFEYKKERKRKIYSYSK